MESNFPYQPVDRVEATWRLPLQKIVVSQWLADIARDRFGDSTSVLVPNGIDLNLFHAPPRGKQSRPTVGMLYAPRSPHKGNATALAAVDIAARRLPNLLLRAFGTGPLIASMPLPPDAEYTRMPPQHTLREIYARCDVWLCASTSEGYHLPPHEAMACRCPVVSTRVGGPMDLIEDGVNGYLVDVGDTEGLAKRLIDVLSFQSPPGSRCPRPLTKQQKDSPGKMPLLYLKKLWTWQSSDSVKHPRNHLFQQRLTHPGRSDSSGIARSFMSCPRSKPG